MTNFPWTKLEGSHLWSIATAIYKARPLAFNKMDGSVASRYAAAQSLDLAYDEHLDAAILLHNIPLSLARCSGREIAEFASIVTGNRLFQRATYLESNDVSLDISHWSSKMPLVTLLAFSNADTAKRQHVLERVDATLLYGARFKTNVWDSWYNKKLLQTALDIKDQRVAHPTVAHGASWDAIADGIFTHLGCNVLTIN